MDSLTNIVEELSQLRTELQALRREQEARSAFEILNARLAAIVENSEDAIISKTLDGIITTWNAGAFRLFGYTPDEAVGRSIQMLVPAELTEEEPSILAKLRRGERIEHFETRRVRKDGRIIDVSLSISPIRNTEGQIVGASKIARDITAQKQIELELQRSKEAAEEANRAKDHFLAVLSHELRTPLMPLLAELSLIERGELSPAELKTEIASMRRHIELETQLIDDLLDHTRISRGKVQLKRELTDTHALLMAVVEMCQPEILSKHLQVHVLLEATASFTLLDSKRMQQVFWNLLKNAIKFSQKGGRIQVRSANEGSSIVIAVTDGGIGIAPDAIGRIFQPFEQENKNITRRFGGLGLGLSISKAFVEMHKGTLDVSSPGRGRGATFSIRLPGAMTSGPAPLPESPEAPALRPAFLRILLVEDHADTRRLISRLLGARGHHVTTAMTVTEARELLDTSSFDVVVSDVGLPDGSGLEVMRHARECGITRGIAVSGYGSEEDERASRAAGFELHLTKPIDVEKLEAAITGICPIPGVEKTTRATMRTP